MNRGTGFGSNAGFVTFPFSQEQKWCVKQYKFISMNGSKAHRHIWRKNRVKCK